jgi:hypothetical protein
MSENWKPVVGYEAFYEVSDLGRVRALFNSRNNRYKAGRILKTQSPAAKYLQINICPPGEKPRHISLAAMILEAFVGPRPEGHISRHLDDAKRNNVLGNLSWGTYGQNEEDKARNGHALIGTRNHAAKLSDQKVRTMRLCSEIGTPVKTLMRLYGVSENTIRRVLKRESWAHV